jgi:hypothetical protein
MKNIFFIWIGLIVMQTAICQQDSAKSIHFYYNAFLFETYEVTVNRSYLGYPRTIELGEYETTSSHALSFGYQWHLGQNQFLEAELMPFRFYRSHTQFDEEVVDTNSISYSTVGGQDFLLYNSYTRLTYLIVYGKRKIQFVPAVSLQPYYYHVQVKPQSTRELFQSDTKTGIKLEFLPGLQYSVIKDLSLQFSVPLTLMNIGFERTKNDNPILPLCMRVSNQFFINTIDQLWQIRLGLIYTI